MTECFLIYEFALSNGFHYNFGAILISDKLIWSCPKTHLFIFFGCLWGTFVVSKVLGGFFVLSETVATLMGLDCSQSPTFS